MKRLTVLLLAVTFTGLFWAQTRALGEGGNYPRPLGLDWGMGEDEIVDILKIRGRVASITPEIDKLGGKGYEIQPGVFAGYKTTKAEIFLLEGELALVSVKIPAGGSSIETWFRLVYETEKRFGAGERKVKPFSMAEESSAPEGTSMATATWLFSGGRITMAISAQKGASGADTVVFTFFHGERLQLFIQAKAGAALSGQAVKWKDF